MNRIRFLQISDLHISTTRNIAGINQLPDYVRRRGVVGVELGVFSTYNPRKLLSAVELAHEIHYNSSTPLSAIIATGDIATIGSDADLRKALELFEGEPEESSDFHPYETIEGDPTLKKLKNDGVKYMIMPGNHDRYNPAIFYLPRSSHFENVFGEYWNGPVNAYDPIEGDEFDVGIIGADFSLNSIWDSTNSFPFHIIDVFGRGRVYPEILQELKEKTEILRDKIESKGKRSKILWAVHFAPAFAGIPSASILIDDAELLEAARECRVEDILCGHTHTPRIYEPVSGVTVYCCGSTTQAHISGGGTNGCQLIDVVMNDAGEIKVELRNFLYDDFTEVFTRER
ncbi:MAG TPA: metallophosphoesterase [Pyrinomonadaceae bacterium]|jgi:3',5'-cyclic AMP phosphodiesterase CpdA|nr:metallophosphoesterase [Pyrinomonadaceae bacterium]